MKAIRAAQTLLVKPERGLALTVEGERNVRSQLHRIRPAVSIVGEREKSSLSERRRNSHRGRPGRRFPGSAGAEPLLDPLGDERKERVRRESHQRIRADGQHRSFAARTQSSDRQQAGVPVRAVDAVERVVRGKRQGNVGQREHLGRPGQSERPARDADGPGSIVCASTSRRVCRAVGHDHPPIAARRAIQQLATSERSAGCRKTSMPER